MTELEKGLQTDPEQGLSSLQVQERLAAGLSNEVHDRSARTEGRILLRNCLTFFNLLFVVMAVLLLVAGSTVIKLTFLPVVIVNAVIGCVQEIRAKRAVDKLTLVAAQTLRAVRDGEIRQVRSDLLVQDDIVEFCAGNQICADGILRSGRLQVNEALITGEADAIEKNPGDPIKSGSFVIAGTGRAQLTRVGDEAFAAKLAAEAKKDPKAAKSEMMRSLDKLIQVIGIVLIPVGAVLFYQEYHVLKLGLQASAEATAAALVGMVPEGLYLLTSIALAASAIKLTRRRVLVQDMNCIETLARVDVLCVDKTGTITQPVMEVDEVIGLAEQPQEETETILRALYGTGEPENDTARALRERFSGYSQWHCTRYLPFTSETKWCGGEFQGQGAFVAGAPDVILGSRYGEFRQQLESHFGAGSRVLLLAGYEGSLPEEKPEPSRVKPLALVLLRNRIRESAPETFAYFAKQGVQIKVISGDHPLAVSEVAAKAGVENAHQWVDATTLESDEDLQSAAENCTVFGRVTPEKKRSLIRALKAQGHTVAMTGDGVNDVLAMKEADCGIAMASGAQAASQVARLVLLESDFSAMPEIVGEGRRVIHNIQRAAALFLVKNIFSLGLALITFLTGLPYPLEPQHMSIISGLTIGVPSFFLALEPHYEPVRGRFLPGVLRRALPGGLTNILAVVAAQGLMWAYGLPMEQISTVCTGVLAAVGMLVLYEVSKPFDTFRRLIWIAMAVALVGCFTLLSGIFELHLGSLDMRLVLLTALMMAITVFAVVNRCFHWGEKLWRRK